MISGCIFFGFLGGNYNDNYNAGAFYVNVNNDVSNANNGFRLSLP